jgi:glycosyltransferase involved in cell wall biosynthesis
VRADGAVLLLSGLPLDRKPSFFRQLCSLAASWRLKGREALPGGPVFIDTEAGIGSIAWRGGAAPEVRWRLEGSGGESLAFAELVSRTDPAALIALGYPDQFPFLHGFVDGTPLPCFLWSQFSRPPGRGLPEPPTYIPLTARTASYLRAAGCSTIGPIIPHGVDTRLFSPLPDPERSRLRGQHGETGALVVGTVANTSRRKRLDLILRSFALFSRGHERSRLLIKTNRRVALDGVDLPGLIAREKVGDRVEIIATELGEPEMAELYNRMDLYLNLSEWEGFCIPVIEAMACAVPVVSLPIQGPGEILPYPDTLVPGGLVREEEGTVLFEADPRNVCAVLKALADGKGLRERLGREGREAALSRYDIRRIAEQWEEVLQRI